MSETRGRRGSWGRRGRIEPAFLPLLSLLPLLPLLSCRPSAHAIVVGSKNFSESVLLGEIVAQQLQRAGLPVERKLDLGGTFVCHQAMVAGQLDVYVEYTGTAYGAVLKLPTANDREQVRRVVDSAYRVRWNMVWGKPLGFNNTFSMVVRRDDAARLPRPALSAAKPFAPSWRAGVGYEFMERADGYRGLTERYGLTFRGQPAVMDLGLIYRALVDGQVDIVAGNSTDAQIEALHLVELEDDLQYFPPYYAAPLARAAALTAHPAMAPALDALAGTIDAQTMRELNYQIDVLRRRPADVARSFLDGVPAPAARAPILPPAAPAGGLRRE